MKNWQEESGYTLMETLVAFILLFIVLIPFTRVMIYLFSDGNIWQKIWVINSAEKEMEMTLLAEQFYDAEYSLGIGRMNYQLRRTIHKEDRIIKIRLEIIHPLKRTTIFTLSTVRRDVTP